MAARTKDTIDVVELQPCCAELTRPNTSSIRPLVTERAPARSYPLCACSSFDSGTIRSAAKKAMIPIGTLMKKIQRQENAWVSAPPSTSPTAEPPIAMAAQTPSARARSFPSANVVEMIESAAGEMSAAPRPCRARKPISIPELVAIPFRNEAAVKMTRPMRKNRFRPRRSPTRPPSRRKPANTRV